MKNKLIDIHNMLVATLEDLDDAELLEEENEAKRNSLVKLAIAKCNVVKSIVEIDKIGLAAMENADFRGHW